MMDSYSGEEGTEKHNLYFKLLDMIEEYQTIPQPMAVQIANMFLLKITVMLRIRIIQIF